MYNGIQNLYLKSTTSTMKPDEVVHGIGGILVTVGSVLFMTADIVRLYYNDVNHVSTGAGEILPGFSSVMLAVGFLVLFVKHAMEVKNVTKKTLPQITLLVSFAFLTAAFTMMGIDSFESSKRSLFTNTNHANSTCSIFEYPGLFDTGFSGNAMNDFIAAFGLSLALLSLVMQQALDNENGKDTKMIILGLSCISSLVALFFYGMEMHDNGSNTFGETNGYLANFDAIMINTSNREFSLMMMFLFSASIATWFAINRKEGEKRVEKAGRWLAGIASFSFFLGAFLSMIQAFAIHGEPYSPLLSCDGDFFTDNPEGARTVYFVASGFMSTAAVVVSVISIAAMRIIFPEENNDSDVTSLIG